MDLETLAMELLEELGIRAGQKVLDFGCGSGTYAIPASRIVGQGGRIYALDRDQLALDEVAQRADKAGIGNMERIKTSGILEIDLEACSLDAVLLFDVFHRYYFPGDKERRELLGELHRVLKPRGLLLVYPKHMEDEAEREIRTSGFDLRKKYSATLIHDEKDLVQGYVLVFERSGEDDRQPARFQ
ncbi:MAG: class I SAM-dependent methyltransferase [Deltaproteobacteria bacterium]|nr:class I SAM-dependent methyltransferase [Deltaproteobacteria bacterium]MBW2122516.1 class I SAM-dependent methyltransferase [Deltaproteobacteria bacterium]